MRRYLIVMEVETDIELDRGGPPFSAGSRWSRFDVYPNTNSENYEEGNFNIELAEVCAIKNMGEVEE